MREKHPNLQIHHLVMSSGIIYKRNIRKNDKIENIHMYGKVLDIYAVDCTFELTHKMYFGLQIQ